jgi:hypothetical protein
MTWSLKESLPFLRSADASERCVATRRTGGRSRTVNSDGQLPGQKRRLSSVCSGERQAGGQSVGVA